MRARSAALVLSALALSGGLVGVHLAAGGADYVPREQADPCRGRPHGPKPVELEPLAELIVLTGLQQTACRLGVNRVHLILGLRSAAERRTLADEVGTDERGLARALTAGLLRGIDQLDRAHLLPSASQLLPSLLSEVDLPGIAEDAIRRLPHALVDSLLPTAPVLKRSVLKIDMEAVLRNIDDPKRLEAPIRDAVVKGVEEEARKRLGGQVPGPLRDILGI